MKTQNEHKKDTVSITVTISRKAREKLSRIKGILGCNTLDKTVTSAVNMIDMHTVFNISMAREGLKSESIPKESKSIPLDSKSISKESNNVDTKKIQGFNKEISDDLFTYIKSCMISASKKPRNEKLYDFDPNNITADSVKVDLERIIPSLFNPYALLSKDEMAAMVFGVGVRNEFNAETMDEFHNLKRDGLIKIIYNDYRKKKGDEF